MAIVTENRSQSGELDEPSRRGNARGDRDGQTLSRELPRYGCGVHAKSRLARAQTRRIRHLAFEEAAALLQLPPPSWRLFDARHHLFEICE